MANLNSLYTPNSRYVYGGITETSTNKLEWWDRNIFTIDDSDLIYVLEAKFSGRPDLVSLAFYNDTGLWWLILQYNNILDILNEFTANTILRIPNKDRIIASFNKSTGIPSQRTYLPD